MTLWPCPRCSAERGHLSPEFVTAIKRNPMFLRCLECFLVFPYDWWHPDDKPEA